MVKKELLSRLKYCTNEEILIQVENKFYDFDFWYDFDGKKGKFIIIPSTKEFKK